MPTQCPLPSPCGAPGPPVLLATTAEGRHTEARAAQFDKGPAVPDAEELRTPLQPHLCSDIPKADPQPESREGNGTHPRTLAWTMPGMEEPGGLQSVGSRRFGHDRVTSLSLFTFMHWGRKWQPTPAFLPGESQGRGSLVGYSPRGHKQSDTTEHTRTLSGHPVLHTGPPGGSSFSDSLSSSFQIQLVIPDSTQHNVQLCCFLAASAVP